MARRLLVLVALVGVLAPASSASTPVGAYTKTDVTIIASDGVPLAATLVEPAGVSGPVPAVLMYHGLGGKRQDVMEIAQRYADAGFAVLAPDFRGHGESGGLTSIDGPREIQDVRELYAWLAARPEIDAQHIGGWGISLGGGAILRALGEGVPFAAAETLQTWTNLYTALAPQDLSKSGAVYAFLNSLPENRLAPEVQAIRQDALASTNLPALKAFGAQRSSIQLLPHVTAPVFMMQGRRDFAFDLAQAKAGIAALRGPKRLYMGDFGHAPSKFPGPDIDVVVSEGIRWFKQYLMPQGGGAEPFVQLASDPWNGTPATYTRLPPVRAKSWKLAGKSSIGAEGKDVRTLTRTATRLETFGAATVRTTATFTGGWSHVVAVLTAKTPGKRTIVVSAGGMNATGLSGKRTVTIRLIDCSTLIPRGSRLTVSLASSTTAIDPQNPLYLDVPMPATAHLSVQSVALRLPVLRQPISR